jgi:energy-coupling factor transporter ATP-binding protein EcfA2
MNNKIFLLTGYCGCGKTTAALLMKKLLKSHTAHLAIFDDPVIKDASEKYRFPLELARTHAGKQSICHTSTSSKKINELIDIHRAELKRVYGEDILARKIIDTVYSYPSSDTWIVHDWRSLEDASGLKSALDPAILITVRIVRYGVAEDTADVGFKTSHTIVNDGSIQELEIQLAAMMRQYYGVL